MRHIFQHIHSICYFVFSFVWFGGGRIWLFSPGLSKTLHSPAFQVLGLQAGSKPHYICTFDRILHPHKSENMPDCKILSRPSTYNLNHALRWEHIWKNTDIWDSSFINKCGFQFKVILAVKKEVYKFFQVLKDSSYIHETGCSPNWLLKKSYLTLATGSVCYERRVKFSL